MATRTREELEGLFASASELNSLLDTYCEERHKIDPNFPDYAKITDIDEDGIDIEWETYYGGSTDGHTDRITIADLLDTDFERVRAEVAARQLKAAEAAEQRERQAKAMTEVRERQQLKNLQEKYGKVA